MQGHSWSARLPATPSLGPQYRVSRCQVAPCGPGQHRARWQQSPLPRVGSGPMAQGFQSACLEPYSLVGPTSASRWRVGPFTGARLKRVPCHISRTPGFRPGPTPKAAGQTSSSPFHGAALVKDEGKRSSLPTSSSPQVTKPTASAPHPEATPHLTFPGAQQEGPAWHTSHR